MDSLKPKEKPSSRLVCYVRLNDRDYDRIQKMCETTGESAPELLRTALLDRKDLERPHFSKEDAQEIKVGLNRLGNNINQLAKHVNSGGRIGMNQAFNSFTRAVIDLRHLFLGKYANRKI